MSRRRGPEGSVSMPSQSRASAGTPVPLTSLLDVWVADELITREQAGQILVRGDVLVGPPPPAAKPGSERASLVVEALGYLGGVIILVASILLASMYWDQVSTTGRLAVLGGVTATLLAAGFAVPHRLGDAAVRLRSVLWLLSAGAFAGFLGVLGSEALDLAGEDVFTLTSLGLAAYAAGLWLVGRGLVQQVAMMIAMMLSAAALTNQLGAGQGLPGFAVWAVALIWVLLGWGGLMEPGRLVVVLGSAAMFVGLMMTIPDAPRHRPRSGDGGGGRRGRSSLPRPASARRRRARDAADASRGDHRVVPGRAGGADRHARGGRTPGGCGSVHRATREVRDPYRHSRP